MVARPILFPAKKPLSSQVVQFFDRLPTIPTVPMQKAYAAFIDALVPDGTWATFDVLAVCAVDDAGNSLINLPNGTFKPELNHVTGVPTWTQYLGWLTVGVNNCLLSGHTLAGNAVNCVQNSNMVYAVTTSAPANVGLWRTDADLTHECWPKFNGNCLTKASNATEDSTANGFTADGRYMVNRTNSADYRIIRNGALLGTKTRASTAPETGSLKIGFGAFQIQMFAVGGGLTTGQEATLDNAAYAFLHGYPIGAI